MPLRAARPLVFAALVVTAALPARATVDIDELRVSALVAQQIGPNAAAATTVRSASQRDVGTDTRADASITAPASSPPPGQAGDTGFHDATATAFQTGAGFNATRVDGSFANALGHNRLSATTTWELEGFVRPRIGLTETARLDYMLFPGELGVGRFGTGVEAGFRYEITLVADGTVRFHLESSVLLQRTPGSVSATVLASGPFAGTLSRGTSTRHNMPYDTALTEAYLGSAELGSFTDQTGILLTYTMESWVAMPGYELAGYAQVGDPFGLASDAQAEVARHFPGLGVAGFDLVSAPVPEPRNAALLVAGLVALAWCMQRRG